MLLRPQLVFHTCPGDIDVTINIWLLLALLEDDADNAFGLFDIWIHTAIGTCTEGFSGVI